jgi:5-deoxy-glucuronate isomerase
MERHLKARPDGNYQEIVRPGTLRFLDFARLRLRKGESHSRATGGRESVLDIFSGSASVSIESAGGGKQTFARAGGRADVFSGPPVMLYIPPQSSWEISALSDSLDVGVFSAPSNAATSEPALLEGPGVVGRQVGRGNWERTVYSALAENTPAERLLAGETLNPPGNWSSYPPHKHDRSNPPGEAVLEEIYFFRVRPAQGYGFIWTYTAPDDPQGFSNVFVVEDGDTVLLPKGYHPVVAAPGYQLHYAWVLAGEERRYGAWADDPRHAWVKEQKIGS